MTRRVSFAGAPLLGVAIWCGMVSSGWGQTDLAAAREGARVVAASSSRGEDWQAENLIDGDPTTTWATADGKTEDEWVIVKLATRRTVEIGAIAIDNTPSRDNPPEAGLRDYKLLVSTTGRAPEEFSQVELGSCRLSGGRQVLTFIPARADAYRSQRPGRDRGRQLTFHRSIGSPEAQGAERERERQRAHP